VTSKKTHNIEDAPQKVEHFKPNGHKSSLFIYRQMSKIQSKPVKWLWPQRIALAKLTIIAGNPGLGKSQICCDITARITKGGTWPVDGSECPKGSVILLNAEDDAADTIKPRLSVAGADMDKVYMFDWVTDTEGGQHRSFTLDRDIPKLRQMIEEIGDVVALMIDPVTAYLGDADSHKNAEVRATLHPLTQLAAELNFAVLAVTHMNKGASKEAMMKVMGSLAFVASARAAYAVVKDKEEENRLLFLPMKNNLGEDKTGFSFKVISKQTQEGYATSCIEWGAEHVSVTADQAMSSETDEDQPSELDKACDFLSRELASGPVAVKEIMQDAKASLVSEITLRRAAQKLNVIKRKGAYGGNGWTWELPSTGQGKK
jgi:putative DNA primase/helicase